MTGIPGGMNVFDAKQDGGSDAGGMERQERGLENIHNYPKQGTFNSS
jgi:hypothetical protein